MNLYLPLPLLFSLSDKSWDHVRSKLESELGYNLGGGDGYRVEVIKHIAQLLLVPSPL